MTQHHVRRDVCLSGSLSTTDRKQVVRKQNVNWPPSRAPYLVTQKDKAPSAPGTEPLCTGRRLGSPSMEAQHLGFLKIRTLGAGELTQQLGAVIALAENLGSVPSTHMMAHDKNWVLIGWIMGREVFPGLFA